METLENIYRDENFSQEQLIKYLLLENQRLKDEVNRDDERIESLKRISEYNYKSLQDFLDYTLDEAILLTKSKIGYIYFYDDEKNAIYTQFLVKRSNAELLIY